jgi:DNA-binding transcriptional regulator YiaG
MAYRQPVKIPTLEESLVRMTKLPEDITLIREKGGLNRSQLARALGVSRIQVWQWEKGNNAPREPIIVLSILAWADRLRATIS